jgi:chemotaxis protein CheD
MAELTDQRGNNSTGQQDWHARDQLHPGIVLEDSDHKVLVSSAPNEPPRTVIVSIANCVVTDEQNVILCSEPLGSCIAVAFYDPIVQVGGLLRAMLPDSAISPTLATNRPEMFLDTGIPLAVKKLLDLEGDKNRVLVYVAGGAQITDESAYFNMGKRNARITADVIERLGMRIRAQDIGGPNNRTLLLNMATGEASIKIAGQPKEYRL